MKRNLITYLAMVLAAATFTFTSCGKEEGTPVPKDPVTGPSGTLEVTVMDEDGNLLEEINVQLAYTLDSMSNEKFFASAKTDAAGIATFTEVRISKVYVYANKGTLNDYQIVNIKEDETVTAELTLIRSGDLRVIVKISTTAGNVAGGADVQVSLTEADWENDKYIATGVTDDFGQVLFPNLPVGSVWVAAQHEDKKGSASFVVKEGQEISQVMAVGP
ncbi:MAG: hypothetical protein WD077_02480 [Bacteroidia bacterium]